MKTIICKTETEWVEKAAEGIRRQIENGRPDSVLALACGKTMHPI